MGHTEIAIEATHVWDITYQHVPQMGLFTTENGQSRLKIKVTNEFETYVLLSTYIYNHIYIYTYTYIYQFHVTNLFLVV